MPALKVTVVRTVTVTEREEVMTVEEIFIPAEGVTSERVGAELVVATAARQNGVEVDMAAALTVEAEADTVETFTTEVGTGEEEIITAVAAHSGAAKDINRVEAVMAQRRTLLAIMAMSVLIQGLSKNSSITTNLKPLVSTSTRYLKNGM